ncbi:hypothetical protein [Parvicella tangerina]|uniref:Uncharacterized protein n=1 Tax=Parvicella tangerina TaxID=2829795 RepID=A0A916JL53_9FLAO|nr:hypothetical protein [Parvicella tangerina]CAG5079585.1 hypothetical protein CRYO30217_00982 [Parvicella tangerina]
MRVIFFLTLILSIPLWNVAQEVNPDEKEFVQFIMTNLSSKEKAVEIDNFYRNQEGIYMARADVNSKKFLVLYYSNAGITPEQITTWMDELGIDYKCARHGIHGVQAIIDQKMDCE